MTIIAPPTQSAALSTGVTLEYVEQGDPDGIPVVLLHGITDSWRSFEPVLPHLPEWIRAFAVTQRGHGDSGRPASYAVADFAADVAAFLDAVGVEQAIVVGHSMGASVAQRVAINHAERVRGIVLAGAFVSFERNEDVAELWDYVDNVLADPVDPGFVREFQESTVTESVIPGIVDTAVAESLKVPARVFRDALAGLIEADVRPHLSSITAPTLLAWGERDAFVPRSDQDLQAQSIPNARLVVYHDHGHAMHWEHPERFAADVTAFAAGTAR